MRARVSTIALVLAIAIVANAALASGLSPALRVGTALTWAACLAVAALGLQYGLTLHPRALAAENPTSAGSA